MKSANVFLLLFFAATTLVCCSNLNVSEPQVDPIEDRISYTRDIQPIVSNFCTTCHSGSSPAAGFALTTYDEVRLQSEKGNLLKRINDANRPMPQSGLLPKYMRRMIQKWADGGYLKDSDGELAQGLVDYGEFTPPTIVPVDINEKGFGLLERMQGHWVGSMNLMGQDIPWFAFDYRAISSSHVHGIFEGGTIGNLFTSFFVAEFNGKRTIMARNGGILNGIYRTSYFVLDEAREGARESYYRLVDAYGGKDIMWMELTFTGDQLKFNSYTSRFGLNAPAKKHMRFKGKRMHMELSQEAAKAVDFPKNEAAWSFLSGLPKPDWGEGVPQTSASYIWEDSEMSLLDLAKVSKDPIRIDQMPHVSQLIVEVERNSRIEGKNLLVYLSSEPLTDGKGKFITQYGYMKESVGNSILSFPEIDGESSEFTFTYLHPGKYYLTVIADMNSDTYPSPGDIARASMEINVLPETKETIRVAGINVKN